MEVAVTSILGLTDAQPVSLWAQSMLPILQRPAETVAHHGTSGSTETAALKLVHGGPLLVGLGHGAQPLTSFSVLFAYGVQNSRFGLQDKSLRAKTMTTMAMMMTTTMTMVIVMMMIVTMNTMFMMMTTH